MDRNIDLNYKKIQKNNFDLIGKIIYNLRYSYIFWSDDYEGDFFPHDKR